MDLLWVKLERGWPPSPLTKFMVYLELCTDKHRPQISNTSFATLYISFQDISTMSDMSRHVRPSMLPEARIVGVKLIKLQEVLG